jgi:hypothetical protein
VRERLAEKARDEVCLNVLLSIEVHWTGCGGLGCRESALSLKVCSVSTSDLGMSDTVSRKRPLSAGTL